MSVRSLVNVEYVFNRLVLSNIISVSERPPSCSSLLQSIDADYLLPRVVDATLARPGTVASFRQHRLPGAVFFDLHACSGRGMEGSISLPSPSLFEEYANHLGIGADTEVIVYDDVPGFCGLYSAPCLWWLFRVFGHDAVSVLDGGFDQWRRLGLPVSSALETDTPEAGRRYQHGRPQFRASYRRRIHKTFSEMRDIIERRVDALVVDTRFEQAFKQEPGVVDVNIPGVSLLNMEKRVMKSVEEISAIFSRVGIDLSRDDLQLIAVSNNSVTACSLVLAAKVVAEKTGSRASAAVYDGSIRDLEMLRPLTKRERIVDDGKEPGFEDGSMGPETKAAV